MAPSTQLQRAIAAVKAMKLLGFSQGVAKPVLKELLKVYGNNWEYIEAENYRLLAEAILDSQESKVFYTADGKGWGLRTLEELPSGAFVCEYVGEILTSKELYDRTVQGSCSAKHTYTLVLDADWVSEERLRDEEALCLDATFYGNVGRFVNHRCFDANLVEVPVEWETPDHHYYHLAYFTTRKVEALEELTRENLVGEMAENPRFTYSRRTPGDRIMGLTLKTMHIQSRPLNVSVEVVYAETAAVQERERSRWDHSR